MSRVRELADAAFKAVEYDQGRGFVSDGLGALRSERELWEVLRIHLRHSQMAARKLRAFFKKHGVKP